MLYLRNRLAKKHGLTLPALFFLIFSYQPAISSPGSGLEQLIVLVQPGSSDVNKTFENQCLPEIRIIAKEMGLEMHVVDVKNGAPPQVHITPLIVYQNFRGRSIYQGRTTTPERIRNFIRTARYVPQGKSPHVRENIPIWNLGRAQIWAPLKVAPITGSTPGTYDHDAFINEALKSIARSFKSFQIKNKAELGRSDRGFYMDFYPWVSEDNILFLSLALFSQFHCKTPVFETKNQPLVGPWKDRNELFIRASTIMEEAVRKSIADPEGGDGFDIVPLKTPVKNWKDLGFPLPCPPEKKIKSAPVNMKIPRTWVVAEANPADTPIIQFRFPAPLDNYTGEVQKASGEIYLSESSTLKGTTGFIEADCLSVTMGEAQLDGTLQGSLFLQTKKYPFAKFVIDSVNTGGHALAYGHLSPVSVKGIFTLKGKNLPLVPKIEIEPVLGKNADPLLQVRGAFQIDLRNFGIEGADGPEPAKYTLKLDINLRMIPKNTK